MNPSESPLGKKTSYISTYDPSLLFPMPRKANRDLLEVPNPLPFEGVDIWNCYELSWINSKGKPQIAIAELQVPCTSDNIVESKSLKLYLGSFQFTPFSSDMEVKEKLEKDLSEAFKGNILVLLHSVNAFVNTPISTFSGSCIDDLDVEITTYKPDASLLETEETLVKESLYTHLLKSNCLCTGQPDWGSLWISYEGRKINQASLLKYVISFRNQNDFAEPCIERIYMDIQNQCSPTHLTVYGRYTRRGGIDINPFRTNAKVPHWNPRMERQ